MLFQNLFAEKGIGGISASNVGGILLQPLGITGGMVVVDVSFLRRGNLLKVDGLDF